MACFLVPAAEAVVTTVAERIMRSKEEGSSSRASQETVLPFSVKLGWLNKLLWGGSTLLAFEHVWHGEVVPYFPFLTAVSNGEAAGMLEEMRTAGVMMAVLVTAVWGCMVAVSGVIEKRGDAVNEAAGEGAGA